MGHRATRSKLHASQRLIYIFPLFPSGGGTLRVPGRLSQTNRMALGAEWGGTEARKVCPNWSVRKVLGRGGDTAGSGPAPPEITIVTERALLRVGARAPALCCPSRTDQVRTRSPIMSYS
uniref:Uncharacterized protein n=1 Tax=Rhinolophus ferrumequinum TaxID=59479 RepID=A0A671EZ76_RHIFE